MIIDYSKISAAIEYYKSCGYEYIEVPWFVPPEINSVTKPPEVGEYGFYIESDVYKGELVGSGEQSFIQLMDLGLLKPGKHVCCTPCFRVEPYGYDDLHHPYFMKVELIDTSNPHDILELDELILEAQDFFNSYTETDVQTVSVLQFDIIDKRTGIELGSYGRRSYKEHTWFYGTGLAEPRLSTVLKLNEQPK